VHIYRYTQVRTRQSHNIMGTLFCFVIMHVVQQHINTCRQVNH